MADVVPALIFAALLGIVLGIAGTKGCEYVLERANVSIEWRRSM